MFTSSGFIKKFVWYSYQYQLFRPSYGCGLPSGLLNRVCRHYIRALVMRRLDTIYLLSIWRTYLILKMCLYRIFRLFVFICLEIVLSWTLEFRGRNSFKGGRNVTPGFSNSEFRTQDDNLMNSWVLLYWFYRLNFLNRSICIMFILRELLFLDLIAILSALSLDLITILYESYIRKQNVRLMCFTKLLSLCKIMLFTNLNIAIYFGIFWLKIIY